MVAEHLVEGGRLAAVVEGSGGAVSVDVVHLVGGDACVVQRLLDAGGAPGALGIGSGDVVGVAGGAVADHLAVDLGIPGQSVIQLLQHQDGRALTHDKAAALRVKGDGGPLGVAGSGQSAHGGEAAHGQGSDGGLGAAGEHHLGVAVPDVAEGVAHGVAAAGAGGHRADAHTVQMHPDGNLSRSHIGDGHGDEEGGDLVKAPAVACLAGGLDGGNAADAAGDGHAAPAGVLLLQIQSAVGHRFHRRGDSKLSEAVHPPGLLAIQSHGGVKVLHLGGQRDLLIAVVIQGDGGNAAHAVLDGLPAFGSGVSQGSDRADAGDDNTSFFHNTHPFCGQTAIPPSTHSTWPVM